MNSGNSAEVYRSAKEAADRARREAEMMMKGGVAFNDGFVASAGTAYRATEAPSQPMWISQVPASNAGWGQAIFGTQQQMPSWGGFQPPSAVLGEAIRVGTAIQNKAQSAESKIMLGTGMMNTLPNQLASNANQAMPGMTTTNFLVNGAQNSVSALGSLGYPYM